MDISVVIPTRNRSESLDRCLSSLSAQTHPLHEIIIVDASDEPMDAKELGKRFPHLHLVVRNAIASVCAQRNIGIQSATSPYILLSDDDIEFPPEYVSVLSHFVNTNPECGAVSGILIERSDGEFKDPLVQRLTLLALCWRFLFQLTVWTDIHSLQTSSLAQVMLEPIKKFYRSRGNTWTTAGWPLVTQTDKPFFRSAIFGLGAALIQRDWLLASPFDEILDPNGIGDNYGVAINFPAHQPIVILREVTAVHHRSDVNRLPSTTSYYRRILALHYFMSCSHRFTRFNRLMLLWSLLGNLFPQMSRLDFSHAFATCKAGTLIAAGKNPYLVAAKSRYRKPIAPKP